MAASDSNIISQILENDIEFFVNDVEHVVVNIMECLVENNTTPDLGLWDVVPRKKKARKGTYYKVTVPRYNDDLFKEHFRMSRSTLEELLRVVGNAIIGKADHYGELRMKVMFTIWSLANAEGFSPAGERFGFAKTTAYMVFREMVTVIAGMLPAYVKFPNTTECNNEARIFQRRSHGFPGVIGAIGCYRIRIKAPASNPTDFYNRHKQHSIILQGTCDHKARFIDVSIGMPGGMDGATVLKQSELFTKLTDTSSPLLPPHLHLVGDSAYPLIESLMTPFRDNGDLTSKQKNFNVKLESCRSIIKNAFGLLKAKFRRLEYLDISTPGARNELIAATCVLHNFLIERNGVTLENVVYEEDEENEEYINEVSVENIAATSKRNTIAGILL